MSSLCSALQFACHQPLLSVVQHETKEVVVSAHRSTIYEVFDLGIMQIFNSVASELSGVACSFPQNIEEFRGMQVFGSSHWQQDAYAIFKAVSDMCR